MHVELVSTITSDKVRLDGVLREPTVGTNALQGIDAAVCLHGVHSNFYVPLFYDGLGDYLLASGCAVLPVNTRGHDEVATTAGRRLGAGFEIVDDCKLDIGAWLDFLSARGYKRILLWGHSLGAVKAAYYMGNSPDARIVAAIASSPPRFNYANELAADTAPLFSEVMQQAQAFVAEGKPDAVVESRLPVRCFFSAASYVDKYGPADRYDYFRHLPNQSRPLLITVGGKESGVYYKDINARGPSINTELPLVNYKLVEGADHVYRERVPELWQAANAWLTSALAVES